MSPKIESFRILFVFNFTELSSIFFSSNFYDSTLFQTEKEERGHGGGRQIINDSKLT